MFVILNPSPFVTLSEAKGLDFGLRINSVKNLKKSTTYKTEILWLPSQNGIMDTVSKGEQVDLESEECERRTGNELSQFAFLSLVSFVN
jgi:hypothetical protein